MTLVYNAGQLGDVSENIGDNAKTFRENVEAMFELIDNVPATSWAGATYDAFKTACDTFKTNQIDSILTELDSWAAKFATMSDEGAKNTKNITNIFS